MNCLLPSLAKQQIHRSHTIAKVWEVRVNTNLRIFKLLMVLYERQLCDAL